MKTILNKNFMNSEEEGLLAPYINHCKRVAEASDYSLDEASLCLPTDSVMSAKVRDMVDKKKTTTLKYVIVVGIGGSNLGTKAIYDALYGDVDLLMPDRYPKIIFLDTTDPEFLHAFSLFINKYVSHEGEVLVSIISKSGGTTEIIINAEIVMDELKGRFASWKERVVVISDADSPLWKEAKRLGLDTLDIPKNVGGRYSVFSAVGLFPLALVGININQLLRGAAEMRERCLNMSQDNPALQSSIFQFLCFKENKTIHNSYFFHRELESLGKWFRQLTGESLGKDKKGITPLISMGSVDHHSMVQLYLGGSDDKTTEFIYTEKSASYCVPKEAILPTLNITAGKEVSEIMSAIIKGTVIAYQKIGRLFFEVVLEEVSCHEIGAYMQYKMMEIMYLAKLLGVNAFDQPQVELYKIETRKILEGK